MKERFPENNVMIVKARIPLIHKVQDNLGVKRKERRKDE